MGLLEIRLHGTPLQVMQRTSSDQPAHAIAPGDVQAVGVLFADCTLTGLDDMSEMVRTASPARQMAP
jgi:hypothetical protein